MKRLPLGRHTEEVVAILRLLPPPQLKCRWTDKRKLAVVLAVEAGLTGIAAACLRYKMSRAEYLLWRKAALDGKWAGLVEACERSLKFSGPSERMRQLRLDI